MDYRPTDDIDKEYTQMEREVMKYHQLPDDVVDKLTATHRRDTDLYEGQTSPPDPRIGSKSNKKMYAKRMHLFSQKHILMKLDYQPFLTTCNIGNTTLANSLKTTESLFELALEERGIRNCDLTYGVAEEIYKGSAELKRECDKMYMALKGSNVRDCIELAQTLGTKLWYFQDLYNTAPLWAEIESQVEFSMHILTFKEKVKAFYSFNARFPKKGSFEFRRRLEDNMLKSDFAMLPLNEVLMFSTATRNCRNNDFAYRKFFLNLMRRQHELETAGIESQVGLEIAYTFFNNRMLPFQRKKLVHNDEEREEELRVMDWVYRAISERVGLMSDSDLLRLVSILNMIKVDSYSELGMRATRVILSRIEDIDPDVLLVLLCSLTKANQKRGVGDKQFWDKVSAYILKNFSKFDALKDPLLFCEMFELLAYHQKLPSKDYHKLFRKQILNWLENRVLSYDHIIPLCNGILYMDLTFPNTKTIEDDLKSIVIGVSYQNSNSGIRHQPTLKMMRMYAEAKHPSWNLEVWDVLWYHADREFSPWKLKNKMKTTELIEVVSFVQDKFDAAMLPVFSHQNSFLIDLANETFKFGIYLKTPAHILSSSVSALDFDTTQGRVLPERQLQMSILRAQGWHVYEIDYLEFLEQGDNRADWLLSKLQTEFEKAVENRGDQNREVVDEAMRLREDRINRFSNTPLNEDHAEEILSWKAIMDVIQENEEKVFEKMRIEGVEINPDLN